jgi:hypothetical protein
MINRGDRQHDIAAYFAVNGGRIGETSTGENFAAVSPTKIGLPPAAPYLVLSADLRKDADALQKELKSLKGSDEALKRIERIIAGMEASKIARRGK